MFEFSFFLIVSTVTEIVVPIKMRFYIRNFGLFLFYFSISVQRPLPAGTRYGSAEYFGKARYEFPLRRVISYFGL